MNTMNWVAVWATAMIGLTVTVFAQSTTAPTNIAPAAGQEPASLTQVPKLKAKLLEAEGNAPAEVKTEIKILRIGYPVEKANAAIRLGEMGDKATGAILALIETLGDRTSLEWRRNMTVTGNTTPADQAVLALGKIGSPAVEPLIQLLKDKDSETRDFAVQALGDAGDKSAVNPLIDSLVDHLDTLDADRTDIDVNSDVRRDCETALDKIDPQWRKGDAATRRIPSLLQTLRGADLNGRYRAAEVLGRIGAESALEPLIQALNDRELIMRLNAAEALGKIGDKSAVEPLVQALTMDKESSVRGYAAEALGKIGDKSAVEPLVEAMKKEGDSWTGQKAAEALGKIGDKSALAPLVEALKDPGSSTAKGAALALGKIGDKSAVAPLIQVLKDTEHGNWDTGRLAAESLKMITGQDYGTDYDAWSRWQTSQRN